MAFRRKRPSAATPATPASTPPPRPPPRVLRRDAALPPRSPLGEIPGKAASGAGRRLSPRTLVITAAAAAVIIVGTVYGAKMKGEQDFIAALANAPGPPGRLQERQKVVEAPVEDRIRDLERRRAELVGKRAPLQHKVDELRERIARAEGQQ
ncbi:hypothetical protein GGS23DRAFT_592980 [Durotheca rogersii]|uniref:uncharacterized protein n=1 Tax=Durotheca rogersii TaxID=419775 RepID=UPI00221E7755|nr:uncharacterized protein GGS23DRAFT_592980 [Durotheca rogersii]KAI5867692.1 hypothetical protein GGS23DRAFT_592980 [Durotheca rogersii]